MDALKKYIEIDLTYESPAASGLYEQVESESDLRSVMVSSVAKQGSLAEGLTDAMNNWLNTFIGPPRSQAIAELESEARAIKIGGAIDGRILDVALDEIEFTRAHKTAEAVRGFNQNNKSLLEKRDQARTRFQMIQAEEGGREPKIPNKILEWGILVPAILLPEGLLNFESFRRAPIIQSDAMALGATLLVGIGIAVAAYCIGLYVRQINYFSRRDDEYRSKSGWPLLFWGITLLVVSIGSVAVARYYFMQPLIQEAIILGRTPPNLAFSIGSLLFGNLICFLVGAVITFFFNDPNPLFSEIALALSKVEARIDSKKAKSLDSRLKEINGRAIQDTEQEKKLARQMESMPGHDELQTRFSQLRSKDMEVIGVLGEYRTRLLAKLRPEARFEQRDPSADPTDPARNISREHFSGIQLRLCASQRIR